MTHGRGGRGTGDRDLAAAARVPGAAAARPGARARAGFRVDI
jgi:hypothetical protein